MAAGEVYKPEVADVFHTYSLCKSTDMPEEMLQEAVELCVTATERYAENFDSAAKMIKDEMDQKYGPPFTVIIGESYGFCVTYQKEAMLYMFTGGNIAVLVFRTVRTFSS